MTVFYVPRTSQNADHPDPFSQEGFLIDEEILSLISLTGSIYLNKDCLVGFFFFFFLCFLSLPFVSLELIVFLLKNEEGISKAKLKDNYSEVFQIVINEELSNLKDSMTGFHSQSLIPLLDSFQTFSFLSPFKDLNLDQTFHDVLVNLHQQVTIEFAKRLKEVKERIRFENLLMLVLLML